MKNIVKFLALILLVSSGLWLYVKPGFDSLIATIAALISLVGTFIVDKSSPNSFKQKVSQKSVGIQAGGNVNISSKDTSQKGQ